MLNWFEFCRVFLSKMRRAQSESRRLLLILRGCQVGKRALIGPELELAGKPEYIVLGRSVVLEKGVKLTVSNLCSTQSALSIGDETFIGRFTTITARENVFIGRKVLIAPFCYISETNHGIEKGTAIQDQPSPWKNIIIKDGVWIGNGCTILPGVTIGEGAVIGANSVVNCDIPPEAIAVGCPARVVKYRTSR